MHTNTIYSFILVFSCFLLFTPPAAAQNKNCNTSEYRQFDFWLGDWVVTDPKGKVVGKNTIKLIHKQCALLENWSSTSGFTGSSLNIYQPNIQQWHQTWVDSSGGLLRLSGTFHDGKMTLSDEAHFDPQIQNSKINRISWTPLKDGSVRQLWETCEAPGKPWKTVFDGHYRRTAK